MYESPSMMTSSAFVSPFTHGGGAASGDEVIGLPPSVSELLSGLSPESESFEAPDPVLPELGLLAVVPELPDDVGLPDPSSLPPPPLLVPPLSDVAEGV
jgi:hypothetical protein